MNVYDYDATGETNIETALALTKLVKKEMLTEDEFFISTIYSIPSGDYRESILNSNTNLYDIFRTISNMFYIMYTQYYYYVYDYYNIVNADIEGVKFWEGFLSLKKDDTLPITFRRQLILLAIQQGIISSKTVGTISDSLGIPDVTAGAFIDENPKYCGTLRKLPLTIYSDIRNVIMYIADRQNKTINEMFQDRVNEIDIFQAYPQFMFNIVGYGYILIVCLDGYIYYNPIYENPSLRIEDFTYDFQLKIIELTNSQKEDITYVSNQFHYMYEVMTRNLLCYGAFQPKWDGGDLTFATILSMPIFKSIQLNPVNIVPASEWNNTIEWDNTVFWSSSQTPFEVIFVNSNIPLWDGTYFFKGVIEWGSFITGEFKDVNVLNLAQSLKEYVNEIEYMKNIYDEYYNTDIKDILISDTINTKIVYRFTQKLFYATVINVTITNNILNVIINSNFSNKAIVIQDHEPYYQIFIGLNYFNQTIKDINITHF